LRLAGQAAAVVVAGTDYPLLAVAAGVQAGKATINF
jgi:hypothetical protein